MIELIEFLALGCGVGAFGALLGLGGGLILVPLFMLFMMAPDGGPFMNVQQVVGTSLFVVLCNAMSGTMAYVRQKRILLRAAVPFALATMPGAFLGGYISDYFSGPAFSLTFGTAMILLGGFMWLKSRHSARASASAEGFNPDTADLHLTMGIICSFFVGFLSSILGIGGGVIHVPMMVFLLGFPPQIAVATSTCVLMISAVVGAVSHGILGHILWAPAIMIGIGAVVGAQLGAMISRKSRPSYLVIGVSVVMILLGAQFVYKGLF